MGYLVAPLAPKIAPKIPIGGDLLSPKPRVPQLEFPSLAQQQIPNTFGMASRALAPPRNIEATDPGLESNLE